MSAPADVGPWVIVAGGFHQQGGMDRANAALAAYLLSLGVPVHLVGHEIDALLAGHPLATAHVVRRQAGLPGVAEALLARTGVRVAGRVARAAPDTRVVVNGGNCPWPDINWVHAVHAAWPVCDAGAPWWIRCRSRVHKASARRRERAALGRAEVVVANSERTNRAVVEQLGVSRDRVRTVYLGSDALWGPPGHAERAGARLSLGLPPDRPVVAFVGTLGWDTNKGFDLLWDAWKRLAGTGAWDATLVVAGGGGRLARWKAAARLHGQGVPVHFLGFTSGVPELLAAADLLVSPVRYEAYGLNVHEALCRGLAVMVTRTAGVAERFDDAMSEALLPEGISAAGLADRLRAWRTDPDGWRARAASTAVRIRARSWEDMAAELVDVVGRVPERCSA